MADLYSWFCNTSKCFQGYVWVNKYEQKSETIRLCQILLNFLIPKTLENGEINELYTSKYVTIQAFSETWLVENNLPINTPILAQSGDSKSDRENSSSGHYRMGGQVVISDEEATLLAAIDRERNRYFIIPKGKGCSGKSYEFNEKPKWGKNKPRPTCCVSGFPLFSSDFN